MIPGANVWKLREKTAIAQATRQVPLTSPNKFTATLFISLVYKHPLRDVVGLDSLKSRGCRKFRKKKGGGIIENPEGRKIATRQVSPISPELIR